MPRPHPDGTPIQPSELPQSIPGYLIRLIPELRVDDQVVATGQAYTMGSELIQNAAYFNAATAQWESGADNRFIVAEYTATALDLQGVSAGEVTALKGRLEALKAKMDQLKQNFADPSPIQSLTKETLSGDLLYSAALSYFAAIDAAGQISASASKVVTIRMPSFGNFGVAAQVRLFFGFPRLITFPALQTDIDRVVGAEVAQNGNNAAVVDFRKAVGGQYSAHEHLIPEKLFTDPTDPNGPQAVSAVKAIAVAASQGQRIYFLNAQNREIHASAINQLAMDLAVKEEIANALAVGKSVTTHQGNISFGGFQGVGYIITDPETGAGAYKISDGANGAKMVLTAVGLVLFFTPLITGTALVIAPILTTILAILTVFLAFYSMLNNAIGVLDQGGPCSKLLAEQYLQFFIPITALVAVIGLFGGIWTVEALMLRLIAIMYGGDLYKGVSASRACQ
jgi:hypothetical protein